MRPPAVLLPLLLAGVLAGPGRTPVARAEDEPAAGFTRAPDPETVPGPDADLFREAVGLQARGHYVSARRLLWRLLDEHPDSPYAPEARDRSEPNAFLAVTCMHEPRPSARRIDVALMGDGYLFAQQDRFDKAAAGHGKTLLQEPVYAAYEPYFCFWRFNLASEEAGVDEVEPAPVDEELAERRRARPPRARSFSTALDCKAAGPQGQVMANPERVAHYLSYHAANDGLVLAFAKLGRLGMGGMGIATTAPRGVVVHEFGHAFAGLLDEYAIYPGDPSGFVESANTTTHPESPPWRHFLERKVPGVGVYEGGATFEKGVWRPAPACAMNTGTGAYCPVCREATILTIYTYVSPIDEARPAEREVVRGADGWPAFEVVPMEPRTHRLEVTFHLAPAPEAPATAPEGESPEDRFADDMLTDDEREIWERIKRRREAEGRTALPTLLEAPRRLVRRTQGAGKDDAPPGAVLPSRRRAGKGTPDAYAPVLPELAPGRWLLTAVVRDRTLPRGERLPWVLEDPRGLLEDRRSWILVVPPPSEPAR